MSANPTRRSARISGRNKTGPVQVALEMSVPHASGSVAVDSDSDPEDRPKKKRRNRAKSVAVVKKPNTTRKPRQNLQDLVRMPLDILFEIFVHLFPLDILRLARTSKALRNVLMRRSAVSIWTAALSNHPVPSPPCPKDLTESQWTSLLFDSYCSFCASTSETVLLYVFRVRCCKNCVKERFNSRPQAPGHSESPGYMDHLGQFKLSEMSLRSKMMREVLVRCNAPFPFNHRDEIYRISDIDDWAQEYQKAPKKSVFMKEQYGLMYERREHEALCFKWEGNMYRYVCGIRVNAIVSKLTDLGWGEDITIMNRNLSPSERFISHDLVNQPTELVDSVWTQIMPVLVKFLHEHKAKRVKTARLLIIRDILDNYKDEHSTEIYPPIADLCAVDEISQIIEADFEIDITAKSFEAVVEKFPQLAGEWRHAKDLEILEHLPPRDETVYPKGDVSRVDLAANTWRCWVCDDVITYPRILAHACLSRYKYANALDDPVLEQHCSVLQCLPWNYGKTKVDERMSGIARHVITECGLDPSTAKTADLDEVWVGCPHPHPEFSGSRLVMPYSNVFGHYQRLHRKTHKTSGLSILGPADVSAAYAQLEDGKSYEEISMIAEVCVVCTSCGESSDISDFRNHLQCGHNVTAEGPKIRKHYHIPVDEERNWFVLLKTLRS